MFEVNQVKVHIFWGPKIFTTVSWERGYKWGWYWHVYVLGGVYYERPWFLAYRTVRSWRHDAVHASRYGNLETRYVSTCVGTGSGRGGGREDKSYTLRRVLLQYRVKRNVLQVWPIQASMPFNKVNVYLQSLMIKVPDHVYVLGDTYTCQY
jgi:hypothetical protein